MRFLQGELKGQGIHYYHHTWKGKARLPAFLDDYAGVIAALVQLQEITGETAWLEEAGEITRYVIGHFGETDTEFFLYTHDGAKRCHFKKKRGL